MKRYLIDQVIKAVNCNDYVHNSLIPSVVGGASVMINQNIERILINSSVLATLGVAVCLVGGIVYKKNKRNKIDNKMQNKIEVVQEQ